MAMRLKVGLKVAKKVCLNVVCAALFVLGGVASASAQVITSEGGQAVDPNQQQQQQVSQQPQPIIEGTQPVMQPQPQPAQEPAGEERLVRQVSAYLSVPFFLTDGTLGEDPIAMQSFDAGAGFGIHGRFGWEFGFIVLEGAVGWQIQGVSNTDLNLQNIWIGLGARFQFLNRSRMVPFLSAALRLNIFSQRNAAATAAAEYDLDPGAQVALGLTIEITQSFGIEAAVSSNFLFGVSDSFRDFQFFMQPWVGATIFI